MALYGASLTKEIDWHGHREQFSNVYTYDSGEWDSVIAKALLDQLLVEERKVHCGLVQFVEGRVWEVGGTPQENDTILIQDYNVFGSQVMGMQIYREAAVVVEHYLGRKSTTGRKVYLKKFLRPAALPGSGSTGAYGEAALPQTAIDLYKAYGNAIKNLTVAAIPGGAALCAPDGTHLPLGTDAQVLPFLTHRQFRWTGKRR